MKSLTKLSILSAMVLPLVLAGCDLASISPSEFRSKVAAFDVDLASAMELASAAVADGVVVDAEYDDARWEVEVVSGSNRVRVAVDPSSGETRVLSTRAADAEELAAAQLVLTSPTTLTDALVTAAAAVPGGIAYDIEASEGVYEVELVHESAFFEVEVNPLDGDVDSVEEDDAEDPESDDDDDDDSDDDNDGSGQRAASARA
jgi:hypothetical protein